MGGEWYLACAMCEDTCSVSSTAVWATWAGLYHVLATCPWESPHSYVLVELPEGSSHPVLLKGLVSPWQKDDSLQFWTWLWIFE